MLFVSASNVFFIISLLPSKLHFFSSQVVPHLSISASLVIQLLSLLNLWFQQHKFLFHLKVNLQNVPDLKQFAVIRLVFLSSSIIFVARKFYNSNKTFIIKWKYWKMFSCIFLHLPKLLKLFDNFTLTITSV